MRPGLRGLPPVSQRMNPPLKTANRVFSRGYVRTYAAGSATWTCPETGGYRFIVNGGGGGGLSPTGGGGGSQSQIVRRVNAGETVALVIASSLTLNGTGDSTTATFVGGTVVTAGGGAKGSDGGAGGVASGGDINTTGGAASGITGGTGAATSPFGLGGGNGGAGSGSGSQATVGSVIIMRESA